MRSRLLILMVCIGLVLAFTTSAQILKKNQKAEPEPEPVAEEPVASEPALKLTSDILYFTEPYSKLKNPLEGHVGMCLELDYARIKYPMGFVNTLDTSEALIDYLKRVPITDMEQQKRLFEASGLQKGDRFTAISSTGKVAKASITGFSYVGNSPSSIIVTADLKLEGKNLDPRFFSSHGIALKGEHEFNSSGLALTKEPLSNDDPKRQAMLNACADDLPGGYIIQDVNALPTLLDRSGTTTYFLSYWQRPEEDFEIDDYELKSCLLKSSGGSYLKAELPIPMQLIQAYDLDEDNRSELFALTGNGMEVCYIYMVPATDKYRILKKGMCAGY